MLTKPREAHALLAVVTAQAHAPARQRRHDHSLVQSPPHAPVSALLNLRESIRMICVYDEQIVVEQREIESLDVVRTQV